MTVSAFIMYVKSCTDGHAEKLMAVKVTGMELIIRNKVLWNHTLKEKPGVCPLISMYTGRGGAATHAQCRGARALHE